MCLFINTRKNLLNFVQNRYLYTCTSSINFLDIFVRSVDCNNLAGLLVGLTTGGSDLFESEF